MRFPVRGRFQAAARVQAIFEPQEHVTSEARYQAFAALFSTSAALLVVALLNHWS